MSYPFYDTCTEEETELGTEQLSEDELGMTH